MQSKSSRAFRTISEAADELDLKPHVLRFWEAKFPDLQPVTRGGGRRFYRPEDVDFLRGLRILLHDEKHKIKDVQKLIKVKGAQSVVELGHSAAERRPSRPIEERDLVPDRIKAAVPQPVVVQTVVPVPKPAPAPMPPASVAERELQPAVQAASEGVQPVVVPFTPAEPKAPEISAESEAELSSALTRLQGLRGRWEKFAEKP